MSRDSKIQVGVIVLEGPVTVASRRAKGMYHCRALQFDLVGVGRTKREAFAELRLLVEDYLGEVVSSTEPVRFFNPSSSDEWNVRDRKDFRVRAVCLGRTRPVRARPTSPPPLDARTLRELCRSVEQVDLVPASA